MKPAVPARKTIIVAKQFGRVGNRLCAFAQLIAWACEHDAVVVNPMMQSYGGDFACLEGNHRCAFPPPDMPGFIDRHKALSDALRALRATRRIAKSTVKLYQNLPLPRDAVAIVDNGEAGPALNDPAKSRVFFRDWLFRVPELVTLHAETIRAFLKPSAHHLDAGSAAVAGVRKRADVVVGVHIRHGDYADYRGGKYFFDVARYVAWMETLAADLAPRRVGFMVCSDAALDALSFPGLLVGFGPGTVVGDLAALAASDLVMGPVSTFNQWASFYGNTPRFVLRSLDSRPELGSFEVSDLAEIPGHELTAP